MSDPSLPHDPITRRDAFRLAARLGAVVAAAGAGALSLDACAPGRDRASSPAAATTTGAGPSPTHGGAGVLDAEDQALVEAIADTLLPTTAASPGAAAAGVGPAVNVLLTDCYDAPEQRRVVEGLRSFRATCRAQHGTTFAELAPAAREQLLRALDDEARRAGSARAAPLHAGGTHGGDARADDAHYFGLVRELAERAYFSSQIGTTRALRYVREPGRWSGCVPLTPGQPAWA